MHSKLPINNKTKTKIPPIKLKMYFPCPPKRTSHNPLVGEYLIFLHFIIV
ncbi:MAG: hypothetical protein L6U99_10165 [Clostridium sp.]|nr:MAG: hypothetical protein L6U99_10165 [Clostridium sp.]